MKRLFNLVVVRVIYRYWLLAYMHIRHEKIVYIYSYNKTPNVINISFYYLT